MLLELPQVAIRGTTSLGIAPWLYFSWRLLLDCKAGCADQQLTAIKISFGLKEATLVCVCVWL